LAGSRLGKRAGRGRGSGFLVESAENYYGESERWKKLWDGEKEEWDAWVIGSDGECENIGDKVKGSTEERSLLRPEGGYRCVLNVEGHEDTGDSRGEEGSFGFCGEGVSRIYLDRDDEVKDE
jgi:hypothetical protein